MQKENNVEVKLSPVIKWAGGKKQLLKELERRLPEEYNRYYEPFIGGQRSYSMWLLRTQLSTM